MKLSTYRRLYRRALDHACAFGPYTTNPRAGARAALRARLQRSRYQQARRYREITTVQLAFDDLYWPGPSGISP